MNTERRMLMKEEDAILRKVGVENPFQVPEGYFDRLTSEVMSNLPEKETSVFVSKEPTLWEKVKPWAYMAAMFAGAALIIRIASSNPASDSGDIASDEMEIEYISAVVDNSMLDDYALYVYLSDVDVE